jgi:hypothetical protein
VVGDRVTDQQPAELAALLANLVQQQTALLQVHTQNLELQRFFVERLLGIPSAAMPGSQSEAQPRATSPPPDASPKKPLATTPPTSSDPAPGSPSDHVEQVAASDPGDPTSSRQIAQTAAPAAERAEAGAIASHAARYYQARSVRPGLALAPVQPQDLELMRRLHEMRDASGLILQFGPHKGNMLAQVAIHDPDYVRQLVLRAQRPEVRAAASRLVEALDAAAAHKPRPARGTTRRSRSTA